VWQGLSSLDRSYEKVGITDFEYCGGDYLSSEASPELESGQCVRKDRGVSEMTL